MDSRFKYVASRIRQQIEDITLRSGVLCRVFARGKSEASINKKIESSPGKYGSGRRLIQDSVGVRVVVYFKDDIEVLESILRRRFDCDESSSTIDAPNSELFSVTRHNLIFRLGEEDSRDLRRAAGSDPIDDCFEVQIRSMLSEGWHEVEHDLRYKCRDFWTDQEDLSRALNGVIATLETSEWSMARIFDNLSYRHYRGRNWTAMLHTRLRLRTVPQVDTAIVSLFDSSSFLAKQMSRIDRVKIIHWFENLRPHVVPSLNNAAYLWNLASTDNANEELLELTPKLLKEAFFEQST